MDAKIQDHALNDDEIDALMEDLRSIPQAMAAAIRDEFLKAEGTVSVLIPRSRKYYRGLIGDRGEAKTVEEYAAGNAHAQVERLLKWNFRRGLAQCLLFCANPRLSALIDISGKPAEEIERFYPWLANEADRFSQIAGIEMGVRSLTEYPQLEPISLRASRRDSRRRHIRKYNSVGSDDKCLRLRRRGTGKNGGVRKRTTFLETSCRNGASIDDRAHTGNARGSRRGLERLGKATRRTILHAILSRSTRRAPMDTGPNECKAASH